MRGCIGSLAAQRALVADVAWNAYAAAFEDSRFDRVGAAEFDDLVISVSVLGVPQELNVADEDDLLRQLRPGIDGLILRRGQQRGLFLPQVWEGVESPRQFLDLLKRKAGMAEDHWPDDVTVERFSAESFEGSLAGTGIAGG